MTYRRMIVRNRRVRSNNNVEGQTEVVLLGVLGQVVGLSLNSSGSPELSVVWDAALAKAVETPTEEDPCAEGWQEDGVPISEVEYVHVRWSTCT